jgi:hypothetical protein
MESGLNILGVVSEKKERYDLQYPHFPVSEILEEYME